MGYDLEAVERTKCVIQPKRARGIMKGISSVIAIILLLLITISIIGFTAAFFQGTVKTSGEQAQGAAASQAQRFQQTVDVVTATANSVTIRNIGSAPITSGEISILVDGKPATFTGGTINPGSAQTFTLTSPSKLLGSQTVKVVAPGNTASKDVTSPNAVSCKDYVDSTFNTGDGLYTIYPVGSPLQVYCDMTVNGGGWTLAAVCRPSGSGVCWNTGTVGTVTDPNSAASVKLSDSMIRTILNSGEKTTRAYWTEPDNSDGGVGWSITMALFNKFENPSQWSSAHGGGTAGAIFYRKYEYAMAGNPSYYKADPVPFANTAYAKPWETVTASSSNGWSNINGDSSWIAIWDAFCENGPTMIHNCGDGVERRADVIVWLR